MHSDRQDMRFSGAVVPGKASGGSVPPPPERGAGASRRLAGVGCCLLSVACRAVWSRGSGNLFQKKVSKGKGSKPANSCASVQRKRQIQKSTDL